MEMFVSLLNSTFEVHHNFNLFFQGFSFDENYMAVVLQYKTCKNTNGLEELALVSFAQKEK